MKGSNIILIVIIVFLLSATLAYAGVEPISSTKDNIVRWLETTTSEILEPDTATSATGLNLSSEYSKTYLAYEQDLGGGLKLYSKVALPPPNTVCNYKVKWSTGVCYAVKVEKTSEGVTMIGYWEVKGAEWNFHNAEFYLEYKIFGRVDVSRVADYQIR